MIDHVLPSGPITLYGSSAPGRAAIQGVQDVQYVDAPTQEDSLEVMASIVEGDAMESALQGLARLLTKTCPARSDWCELRAIYNGVKLGQDQSGRQRSDLKAYGLDKGLRYLADARTGPDGAETDVFFKPSRTIAMLQRGENGADCDDQAMLIAALGKDCGFRMGLRAYGEGDVHGYEHVYAIALIPKRGPWKANAQSKIDESHVVGLDTTVPSARTGWQPPVGEVFTVLLG